MSDLISRTDVQEILFYEAEGWPTAEEIDLLKRLKNKIDALPTIESIDNNYGRAEQVLRTVYDYCALYIKTNKKMENEEREAGTLTDKWLYYHMGADKLAFEIMRKLEIIYPDVFVNVYGAKKDD